MVGEIDAEEIPSFAFEPTGRAVDAGDRRHRIVLVCRHFDADAVIEFEAEEIVDDLEPLGAVGIVDAAEIDQHGEATFWVVTQEGHDADDPFASYCDDELAVENLSADHIMRQRRRYV